MKKLLYILLIALWSVSRLQAEEIKLSGIYQGENLLIMNSFAASGVGFCIYEVQVNGQVTTDEINSSAFEVDLSVFHFKLGDPVTVLIKHKSGCVPKILNAETLKPRSTFEIEGITIEKTGTLKWVTVNEKGELPFVIQQFRWDKWKKVGTIQGMGTPQRNTYTFAVDLHTGINKFRVMQTDFSKKERRSPEATYRNLAPSVTFEPGDGKKAVNEIKFSAETSYEIYDLYGKLLLGGKGKKVDIAKLGKGQFFINYDNVIQSFKK